MRKNLEKQADGLRVSWDVATDFVEVFELVKVDKSERIVSLKSEKLFLRVETVDLTTYRLTH